MVTNIDIPISTTTLAGLLGSDTWLSFRGPGHSYVVSVARPFGSGFVVSYKVLFRGNPIGPTIYPDRLFETLGEVVDFVNVTEVGRIL